MSLPVQSFEVPDIQPFWQRLPRFFLYPLHLEPLRYIFFLSLCTWLVFLVPFGSLFVSLGIMLAFIRYAYKILDYTAAGLLTPDEYHVLDDDPDRTSLPYKLFGVFFVIGIAGGLAGRAGGLFFGVVIIYFTLSVPAIIMTLAVTRSFWATLNPLAVIQTISAIGMPYLGLSAFIFLLEASESVLLYWLLPYLSPWLIWPATAFVTMYFTLIMFNMMGYAIYQYHHLLGIDIQQANSMSQNSGTTGSRMAAGGNGGSNGAVSYADLIASGQIDKALDIAYEAQRNDPENITAHGHYHKLLLLSDPKKHLLPHARRYLALLLKKGMVQESVELFRKMRERDPAFEPKEAAQLLLLAKAVRQTCDFTLALSLLNGFDKRFPDHAETPAVYFFAAQTLCENLHKDDMARKILTTLLERYPTHPVSGQAQQLLAAIKRMPV